MIDNLLNLIAPHHCCLCGESGSLLCESCKYDIIEEDNLGCLLCGRPSGTSGTCNACRSVIERAWYIGERAGGLEVLINRYKFERAQAAFKPLGDLLLTRLPVLPAGTIIVPIPTARPHVRQRGYDHALLLARHVAGARGLPLATPLVRLSTTTQRSAGRERRISQAKTAFEVKAELQKDVPYLLVDDIVTTGATLMYAAKAMRSAGATVVWAAAVARQPFDEQK